MGRTGRVAIVTGATGAIGEAIARGLAAADHAVWLACRNAAKAKAATARISAATGNHEVRPLIVDLSDRGAIDTIARDFRGPLHVLINNAADTPPRREETRAGLERQFATNVMGYVWMTRAFTDALARGGSAAEPARVVNVASYWAGGLDVEDLQFVTRAYSNGAAYRQSKQANRMLSVAFAERLRERAITVNACHPGDVNSPLSNSLGFGGHESPDQGADTPVWVATDPAGRDNTGAYFEHRRNSQCRFAEDGAAVAALYAACMHYCR